MYPQTQQQIKLDLAAGVYPGVNYGFIKKNQCLTQSFGYRQVLPHKEKMTPETLFDVASLTKVIGTTSLILKLAEAGTLDLDRPLHDYLPSFKNNRITSRHLLTHTSNLNGFIEKRDELNQTELRKALLKLQPADKVGLEVVYTDSGTLLLGFLIEEIYQQPVQQLITKNVLTPLGMTASTFKPTGKNIAATENHPRRGLIKGEVHDPKASVLKENCGSAGLFSTLEDCLIFCQMILNDGQTKFGEQFLQPETIKNLFKDQTPTGNLKRSLGWDLKFEMNSSRPLLFHTGYTGTFLLIDQVAQEAFVFLSNRVHPVDKRQSYLKNRDQLIEIYLGEKAN